MKNEKVIQVGGKTYIKAKVVMLATEKESKINDTNQGLLYNNPNYIGEFQHLYFLSEEGIKEGDYYFDKHLTLPQKCQSIKEASELASTPFKKIIATTDESLNPLNKIGDDFLTRMKRDRQRLPRPSNEFLQAYCKANGKIDEVLVEVGNSSHNPIPNWKLKLSPDNTITTKRVEGRMHSNAEVRELFIKAAKSNLFEGGWKTDLSIKILDKWISENL